MENTKKAYMYFYNILRYLIAESFTLFFFNLWLCG